MRKHLTVLSTALLSLVLLVSTAATADAHVRVSPDSATAGSYAVLTFRVPTESAKASTTQIALTIPTDTPISSVSYEPVAGWTAKITTSKLPKPVNVGDATLTEAVTKVVWTADNEDSAIAPGQFQRFSITAGPIPDIAQIVLPVNQTYSDGTVVDWAQETPTNGAEPQYPAPVLHVGDASTAPAATNTSTSTTTGSIAIVLAAAALILAAAAVLFAASAIRRSGTLSERRRRVRPMKGSVTDHNEEQS